MNSYSTEGSTNSKEVPNNNDVEEEEEDPIDKIFNATLISSSTSNSQDLKEKQGINQ